MTVDNTAPAIRELVQWSETCSPDELLDGLVIELRRDAHRRTLAVYFELLGRRRFSPAVLNRPDIADALRLALRSKRLLGIRGKLALSLSRSGRHAAPFTPDILPLRHSARLKERAPARKALRRILTDAIALGTVAEAVQAVYFLVRAFHGWTFRDPSEISTLHPEVAETIAALEGFLRELLPLWIESRPEFHRLWCRWIESAPVDFSVWRPAP